MKKAFLITLLAIIATTFIRYQDLVIDTLVMFVLFAIISYLLTFKNKWGYFYVPIFIILIYCLVSVFDLCFMSKITIADVIGIGAINFLSGVIGSLIGAFINYTKSYKRIGILLFVLLLAIEIWYVRVGNKYWFNLINEGTLTGKVDIKLDKSWEVKNEDNRIVKSTERPFKDKIVVLDFWFQSCGSCFKSFPNFQTASNNFINDTNIYFAAVNIPMEQDPHKNSFSLLRERKYTFAAFQGNDSLAKFFSINKYPTVIVLHNDSILFSGNLDLAIDYITNISNSN